MKKHTIVILIVLLITTLMVAITVSGFYNKSDEDIIDEEMEAQCDAYLSDMKVGETKCCQIGWSISFGNEYELERCITLG